MRHFGSMPLRPASRSRPVLVNPISVQETHFHHRASVTAGGLCARASQAVQTSRMASSEERQAAKLTSTGSELLSAPAEQAKLRTTLRSLSITRAACEMMGSSSPTFYPLPEYSFFATKGQKSSSRCACGSSQVFSTQRSTMATANSAPTLAAQMPAIHSRRCQRGDRGSSGYVAMMSGQRNRVDFMRGTRPR